MKSVLLVFFSALMALASGQTLFAVVGGSECAEQLFYGDSALTTAGSADSHAYYFNTQNTGFAHNQWLQVVTSDGTTELFRVAWSFDTAMTLQDRFTQGTISNVQWYISDTAGVAGAAGAKYTFTGTWQYSATSTITAAKLQTTTTTAGFSGDDGAWGGASGVLTNGGTTQPAGFWGIGNFNGADTSCQTVYANGNSVSNSAGTKVFMYLAASPTSMPSSQPSSQPTNPTSQPTGRPSRQPTRQPSSQPTRRPTGQPSRQPSRQPSMQPTSAPSRFAKKRGYRLRQAAP